MFLNSLGQLASIPGGRTYYQLQGKQSDDLVVLVHGFSSQSEVTYGFLVQPLLDASYHVLSYDLWGRGHSDAPLNAAYDSKLFTHQLLDLLEHLGLSCEVCRWCCERESRLELCCYDGEAGEGEGEKEGEVEKEREREGHCMRERESAYERERVCVCVCIGERERVCV
jgi:alpha/beta hydrolase fold